MALHKYFIALFVGLLLVMRLHAQDFDNYVHIRSSGKIPQKFTTSSTEKYKKEASENISSKDKRTVRNTKNRFYVESNFVIDELLLSGKVLFNDPVSQYVNKVLDELLKNDKTLREKVEVYVVRTDAVNAFTTNNGVIFVCMGLLAQLENEAQLAFILGHELVHFKEQHALDEFLVKAQIERGEGKYRYHSYDERVLARSNYSKEKETESDLEGFSILLKSDYDLETAEGVFDVLQFAHLPFDEVPFRKDFLETADFKFPDEYFLKETKAIEANDEDDEYGTHPSVKIRRAAIRKLTKENEKKNRKKFILNEKEFYTAQQICRYEIASAYLLSREYENSIYTSYLLLQENPNSVYLKKTILKALYGLTKYGNADKFNEVHTYYDNVEGSKQQVHHLFEVMDGEELNATALNYAWNLKKQYPNDVEIAQLTDDIFAGWVEYFYPEIDDLPTKSKPEKKEKSTATKTSQSTTDSSKHIADTTAETESVKKRSKYDKIKEQLKEAEEEPEEEEPEEEEFAMYGFVDELKDTAFVNAYKQHMEQNEIKQEEEKLKKKRKYKKEQQAKMENLRKKGYMLGLKKVVFVNPFYHVTDNSKPTSEINLQTEASQKNLSSTLKESAKDVKLSSVILDKKSLKEEDVETFNDLALLNEYIDLAFDNIELEFIHPQQEELKKLATKYNTRYFCWIGVASEKSADMENMYYCCGTVVYPLIPYFVYRLFTPESETSFYSLVMDAETGKIMMMRKDDYKHRDRKDIISSAVYDICLQLKTKRIK